MPAEPGTGSTASADVAVHVLSSVSAFACLCTISVYLWLSRRHSEPMKRISLRISAAMATSELISIIFYAAGYRGLKPHTVACTLVGYALAVAFMLTTLFYSAMLAINTCSVLCLSYTIHRNVRFAYLLAPPLLAAILSQYNSSPLLFRFLIYTSHTRDAYVC